MFMTKDRFQQALIVAGIDAVNLERKRVADSHILCDKIRLESFLDKIVICVSNEPANVMVGFAKGIEYITNANNPVLLVQDLVTKELVIPMGKVFHYTKQRFDALNSLEPNARISLFYDNCFEGTVDKIVPDNIVSSEEWLKIVEQSLKMWFEENEH